MKTTKKGNINLLLVLAIIFSLFLAGLANSCLEDGTPAEGIKDFVTISEIPSETIQETSTTNTKKASETEAISTETTVVDKGSFEAHFIDVGQGDAILIKQDDHAMLIDAGDNGLGNHVVRYLQNQGVTVLDIVIATHPHADHIGGMPEVFDAFDVGMIILPDKAHTTKTFERFLDVIENSDATVIKATPQNTYELGTARIEILGPVSTSGSLNNSSVVCRIDFGQTSFLFMGDAEEEAENLLLYQRLDQSTGIILPFCISIMPISGYNLSANVLKVGHHGSATSSSPKFIDAVDPDVAVIMCGADNNYGHPAQKTLDLFDTKNVSIYRTDCDGTIVITSDGLQLNVII